MTTVKSNRVLLTLCTALMLCLAFANAAGASDAVMHKVAIHVDDNDPKRMNMALNNINNVRKYYESVSETVQIELVAYGPGYTCSAPIPLR